MSRNPKIGILGGYGELVYEIKPPHWARQNRLFASGSQASRSGKVKRNIVYGAGSIMRRSLFNELLRKGFASRLTDRQGNSLSSGGDYELCYTMALAGYDIWYDDHLIFRHFIQAKRLTWEYYVRYFRENARSFSILAPYRFLANHDCRSFMGFHYYYVKTVASYTKKLLPAFLKYYIIPAGFRSAQTNELQFISLKSKLSFLGNYKLMLQHFRDLCKLATALKSIDSKKNTSYTKI